jgi:hypothetical protein
MFKRVRRGVTVLTAVSLPVLILLHDLGRRWV